MAKTKKDAKKAAAAVKTDTDTHLLILIDESGSMSGLQEPVVSGVNEFIHRFTKEGNHRASVAWFDSTPGQPRTRFKVEAQPVKDVNTLVASDYNPRGLTPLNDAIVDVINFAIASTKKREKVFIVILTDGLENASETSSEEVAKLIARYEKKKWGFLYLGTGHNAVAAAQAVGLGQKGSSFNFTKTRTGVGTALRSASNIGASFYKSDYHDHMSGRGKLADETKNTLPETKEVSIPDGED